MRKAVSMLGYRPNVAARALVTRPRLLLLDEEEAEETAAPEEEESEPGSTPDDSAETSPEDSPETEARDDDEQDGIPQQAADRAREALEQGADRGPRRD